MTSSSILSHLSRMTDVSDSSFRQETWQALASKRAQMEDSMVLKSGNDKGHNSIIMTFIFFTFKNF